MMDTQEPDSWEDFEQLRLEPTLPSKPTPSTNEKAPSTKDDTSDSKESLPQADSIDPALKEALKNPRERANVLRIDADVFKFISDKTRCTIEFSSDLTSYQRLLAHRVSQMYGLQTSSVPLGNGASRVIAHKTQKTQQPPVRVLDIKDTFLPPESEKKATPHPEVTIKRRQGISLGPNGNKTQELSQTDMLGDNSRSVKQREQEYKAARDRILGDGSKAESGRKPSPNPDEDLVNVDETSDGKARKAVFRDRYRELQDPDYRRNDAARFSPDMPYKDPYGEAGIHPPTGFNPQTYSSEFPALAGSPGNLPQPYPQTGQIPFIPNEPMHPYPAPPMNLPNNVLRPGMAPIAYQGPYGYMHDVQPTFRMTAPMVATPSGTTQGMVWNRPTGFPTMVPSIPSTHPMPAPRPEYGMYQNFTPYPNYTQFPPGAMRAPYVTVAQGNQSPISTPPQAAGHMAHFMMMRRKPLSSQGDGSTHPENKPCS